MWVFGIDGFVSAVEHRDDPNLVLVRARDRESLVRLIEQIELAGAAEGADGQAVDRLTEDDILVLGPKDADYRYRVVMTKATFAVVMVHNILNHLTYDNFKDAATEARGEDYHQVLMRVWSVAHDLDDVTGRLAPKPVVTRSRKKRKGVLL